MPRSLKGMFNHYVCPECQQRTITYHRDDGVTPMFLTCRATPGCDGMAESCMYDCNQDPAQVPHLVWWRPATVGQLTAALLKMPVGQRNAMRDHVQNGGCLSQEWGSATHAR